MEPENSQPTPTETPPPAAPAPTPPEPASSPADKPSKGYGKRPVWQWVLIYVVVAIVVYGLIYLIFIHKSGGTGSSGY